jgi:hypothetical protein
LDKDNAQTYRLCGLTCCLMAKDCSDRGMTADAKEQWEFAIKYLKAAIWFDRRLEFELRPPLDEAKRNLERILLPTSVRL